MKKSGSGTDIQNHISESSVHTVTIFRFKILKFSVPDPWHVDVDPDPRIYAYDWLDTDPDLDPDLDSDPDSAIFVIDLQDANKKQI
jgi:hypothetical protein